MIKKLATWIVSVLAAIALSTPVQAGKQVIAGAGPSTKVVQMFVEKFADDPAAQSYRFEVPARSAKHAGGIRASSRYVFGRTGRPLNDKEKGMNKGEIVLARIPIAFATAFSTNVPHLSMSQVEALYRGEIANWGEVGGSGGKVILVGREPTEALFSELQKTYPSFKYARFDKVFKKDHQVVNFL